MKFVADTHAFVWYLQDSPRLSSLSKDLFDHADKAKQIIVPTIVLAETLYLNKKLKIPFSFSTNG